MWLKLPVLCSIFLLSSAKRSMRGGSYDPIYKPKGDASTGSKHSHGFMSMYSAKKHVTTIEECHPPNHFMKFMGGAGVGYLASTSSTRQYFFQRQGNQHYYYWHEGDQDVCTTEMDPVELVTHVQTENMTIKANGLIDAYFLCDGTCCEVQCCELNVVSTIFLIFIIVIVTCCGGCCCVICLRDKMEDIRHFLHEKLAPKPKSHGPQVAYIIEEGPWMPPPPVHNPEPMITLSIPVEDHTGSGGSSPRLTPRSHRGVRELRKASTSGIHVNMESFDYGI